MKVRAPAKINLSLKILGRRPDGFHGIETLMSTIRLADVLEYHPAEGSLSLTCSDPFLPVDGQNLVLRAAEGFSTATGLCPGGRIHLDKHIPSGAGLGGGSSDAAATLKMLDRHFQTELGVEKLEELAAGLGSDIPFFIRGGTAWCRGRGEIIEPAASLPSLPIALFKPPFGIDTAQAYALWSPATPKAEPCALDVAELVNDFEPAVFEKYILLPVLRDWLRAQPEIRATLLSGSGSTLFAILHEAADAKALFARARTLFGKTLWTAESRLGT